MAELSPLLDASLASTRAGIDIVGFAPVDGGPLVERFVALGARLQASTPGRIVADLGKMTARLHPDFVFHTYGTAHHFVATKDGRDVGRCSAIVNSRAVEDGVQIGYVGHWECVADDDVAHALLDAAIAHLASSGCGRVVGPVDYSTWYGYRFCLGPHDGEPIMLEPYTPPHYDEQWRSYGFEVQRHYLTTMIDGADIPGQLAPLEHKVETALANGYRFVHLRRKDLPKVLRAMHAKSVTGFAGSPNFTTMELEEFLTLYEGADRMIDPRLMWFALAPDGSVAGFAFGVPDQARAARALAGRSGIRAKLAALRQIPRADAVLFKTLLVDPRHRGQALSVCLTHRVWRTALELGYKRVFHVLMHEENSSLEYSERGGTRLARRYAVYQLPLGGDGTGAGTRFTPAEDAALDQPRSNA